MRVEQQVLGCVTHTHTHTSTVHLNVKASVFFNVYCTVQERLKQAADIPSTIVVLPLCLPTCHFWWLTILLWWDLLPVPVLEQSSVLWQRQPSPVGWAVYWYVTFAVLLISLFLQVRAFDLCELPWCTCNVWNCHICHSLCLLCCDACAFSTHSDTFSMTLLGSSDVSSSECLVSASMVKLMLHSFIAGFEPSEGSLWSCSI